MIKLDTVVWAKWTGDYNDRLLPKGKTHYITGRNKTLCGKDIPSGRVADVECGGSHANCKQCLKIESRGGL